LQQEANLYPRNRKKRLQFAKDLLAWPEDKLKRIMFTDETMLKAYPNGEMVFYRSWTYYDKKTKKSGPKKNKWHSTPVSLVLTTHLSLTLYDSQKNRRGHWVN
jgi:hypothetical protein